MHYIIRLSAGLRTCRESILNANLSGNVCWSSAEAVAEMAAGNAGGGIIDNDWNIRMEPIRDTAESRSQVITPGQSRPQYKIRAELRPDFCDSIDDGVRHSPPMH